MPPDTVEPEGSQIEIGPEDSLENIMWKCGCYYDRKYTADQGPYVKFASGLYGDNLYNISLAMKDNPQVLQHYAEKMLGKMTELYGDRPLSVVGAPTGCTELAKKITELRRTQGIPCQNIEAKKIKTGENLSDKKIIIPDDQEIKEGEDVLIFEDALTTGFSSGELAKQIIERGGKVAAILCILNRSEAGDKAVNSITVEVNRQKIEIPVFHLERRECNLFTKEQLEDSEAKMADSPKNPSDWQELTSLMKGYAPG